MDPSHHAHRLKLRKGASAGVDLASPPIVGWHAVHFSSRSSDLFFSEKNLVWTYQNHSATEPTHGKCGQWEHSFTNCTLLWTDRLTETWPVSVKQVILGEAGKKQNISEITCYILNSGQFNEATYMVQELKPLGYIPVLESNNNEYARLK